MTTGLFHLRAMQVGLDMAALERMSIGMVYDIYAEADNDADGEYAVLATQEDIDNL